MAARPDLYINGSLSIPRAEVVVRVSRAGGAGGQHVNTSSTRVELTWNVRASQAVSEAQRARLLLALAPRLSADGTVRTVASERRSQAQNREAAESRLATIIRRALVVPKVRRPTKPSRGAVERRLEQKHLQGKRKQNRRIDLD